MGFLDFVSILLPIGSTLLGFATLTTYIRQKWTFLETLSCSFPIGMMLNSLTGLLLNSFLSTNFVHFSIQVVASFLIFGFLMRRQPIWRSKPDRISPLSVFGIIASILFYAYLSTLAIFPQKDQLIRTGENDMMLELSLINSFYRGVNRFSSWFTSFQIPLDYKIHTFTHVIPPFYSALLKTLCTTRLCILTPTIFLFASISIQIFCLTKRLSGSEFASLLSIPSLFLIGGFGYRSFSVNANRDSPVVDYIFNLGTGGILNWAHPLLHNFLTSRLSMTTLALSLVVYIALESDSIEIAGFAATSSLLVRPQTGVVLFLVFFLYRPTLTKRRFVWILFPALWLLISRPTIAFNWAAPLWRAGITENALVPWLSYGFHVYGFMFGCLIFALTRPLLPKLVLALVVFSMFSVVGFQPDHRFNFFAAQSIVTPLIVAISLAGLFGFLKKLKNPEIGGVMTAVGICLVVFSWAASACGLVQRISQKVTVWGEEQNEIAKWVCQNTKRNAVFWAPANRIWWNPAVARAGRVAFLGYQNTLQDFKLAEEADFALISEFAQQFEKRIGVDYFLLPKDHDWMPRIEKAESLEMVYGTDNYQIYAWK
jgi:hypothetical protein